MKKAAKSLKSFFRSSKNLQSPLTKVNEEEAFRTRFKLGKVLGKGNFSVVRQAEDTVTGDQVAVKCMSKASLNEEDRAAIKHEVEILKGLKHEHIIDLYGMYEDKDCFYIVTELLEGGELFDRIVDREFYSEHTASVVVRTIADALKFCNDNGVVHRDLKPENVLLVDKDDDTALKLADFGFAKEVNPEGENELKTTCGTPGYVAPEIIGGKKYGKEVDMWSLGVILYILLCGYPPFYDDNQAKLFSKIKRGKFIFDPAFWGEISDQAKDLVKGLLVVDPMSRLTVEEVLAHDWIKTQGNEKDITPVLDELRSYQARRRLKRVGHGVLAAVKLNKFASTVKK